MRPYTGSNNMWSTYAAIEVVPIMSPTQIEAKNEVVKRMCEAFKEI